MSPGYETLASDETITPKAGRYLLCASTQPILFKIETGYACGNYVKLLNVMNPTHWFDGKEFDTLKEMNDYKAAYNNKNAIKFLKNKNFRK